LCLVITTTFLCAACSSPTAPPPVTFGVTAISPTVGSTTGGTIVTITGTEFTGDITVAVGGVPATNVTLQGTTSLTAVVGAHSTPGTVDVAVTSAGRTATLPNGFAFIAPSGANQPPAINSIRSAGPYQRQPSGFADLDQTVTLIALVTDNETPTDALSYEWKGPGTFSGSTPTVQWHLPATLSPTPSPATATLTVTETFTEGKLTHTNSTTATFVMDVHDSQKEILDMGQDFLTLFSQSQIPTRDVLHNFSTTCDNGFGRSDEQNDVDENRATYIEDFSAFRISRRGPATISFHSFCSLPDGRVQLNVDACSSFAVHWEVTKRSTGARSVSEGVDYVSAVLENSQWRLCHSSFIPSAGFPTLGLR
jgi:IPT/TIG domain-containing protein